MAGARAAPSFKEGVELHGVAGAWGGTSSFKGGGESNSVVARARAAPHSRERVNCIEWPEPPEAISSGGGVDLGGRWGTWKGDGAGGGRAVELRGGPG